MKEYNSGTIVDVASYAAISGAVAGVAYMASKHGLVGATKNAAWWFRKEGIRCNAVLPGDMLSYFVVCYVVADKAGVPTNISSSMDRENLDQKAIDMYK